MANLRELQGIVRSALDRHFDKCSGDSKGFINYYSGWTVRDLDAEFERLYRSSGYDGREAERKDKKHIRAALMLLMLDLWLDEDSLRQVPLTKAQLRKVIYTITKPANSALYADVVKAINQVCPAA